VQPVSGGNNRRNRNANNNNINRNAEEEACARELLELQQQQEQQQQQQQFQIKMEDDLVDMNDNGVVTFAACSSPDLDEGHERVIVQVPDVHKYILQFPQLDGNISDVEGDDEEDQAAAEKPAAPETSSSSVSESESKIEYKPCSEEIQQPPNNSSCENPLDFSGKSNNNDLALSEVPTQSPLQQQQNNSFSLTTNSVTTESKSSEVALITLSSSNSIISSKVENNQVTDNDACVSGPPSVVVKSVENVSTNIQELESTDPRVESPKPSTTDPGRSSSPLALHGKDGAEGDVVDVSPSVVEDIQYSSISSNVSSDQLIEKQVEVLEQTSLPDKLTEVCSSEKVEESSLTVETVSTDILPENEPLIAMPTAPEPLESSTDESREDSLADPVHSEPAVENEQSQVPSSSTEAICEKPVKQLDDVTSNEPVSIVATGAESESESKDFEQPLSPANLQNSETAASEPIPSSVTEKLAICTDPTSLYSSDQSSTPLEQIESHPTSSETEHLPFPIESSETEILNSALQTQPSEEAQTLTAELALEHSEIDSLAEAEKPDLNSKVEPSEQFESKETAPTTATLIEESVDQPETFSKGDPQQLESAESSDAPAVVAISTEPLESTEDEVTAHQPQTSSTEEAEKSEPLVESTIPQAEVSEASSEALESNEAVPTTALEKEEEETVSEEGADQLEPLVSLAVAENEVEKTLEPIEISPTIAVEIEESTETTSKMEPEQSFDSSTKEVEKTLEPLETIVTMKTNVTEIEDHQAADEFSPEIPQAIADPVITTNIPNADDASEVSAIEKTLIDSPIEVKPVEVSCESETEQVSLPLTKQEEIDKSQESDEPQTTSTTPLPDQTFEVHHLETETEIVSSELVASSTPLESAKPVLLDNDSSPIEVKSSDTQPLESADEMTTTMVAGESKFEAVVEQTEVFDDKPTSNLISKELEQAANRTEVEHEIPSESSEQPVNVVQDQSSLPVGQNSVDQFQVLSEPLTEDCTLEDETAKTGSSTADPDESLVPVILNQTVIVNEQLSQISATEDVIATDTSSKAVDDPKETQSEEEDSVYKKETETSSNSETVVVTPEIKEPEAECASSAAIAEIITRVDSNEQTTSIPVEVAAPSEVDPDQHNTSVSSDVIDQLLFSVEQRTVETEKVPTETEESPPNLIVVAEPVTSDESSLEESAKESVSQPENLSDQISQDNPPVGVETSAAEISDTISQPPSEIVLNKNAFDEEQIPHDHSTATQVVVDEHFVQADADLKHSQASDPVVVAEPNPIVDNVVALMANDANAACDKKSTVESSNRVERELLNPQVINTSAPPPPTPLQPVSNSSLAESQSSFETMNSNTEESTYRLPSPPLPPKPVSESKIEAKPVTSSEFESKAMTSSADFICNICNRLCLSEADLAQHKKRHKVNIKFHFIHDFTSIR